MDMKFCPKCGSQLPGSTLICPNCGYSFNNQASSLQPQPTPKKSNSFLIIFVIIIIALIILGGFAIYMRNSQANNNSTASSSTSSSLSTSTSQSSQDSSSVSSSTYYNNINWNVDKQTSFDNSFNSWADKMHQSYTSGSTTFDGISYPADFSSKQFIINGSSSTISMAGTNRNTEYKVVEIRYDSYDGYLYLFAFQNGTPIVLFTQSGYASGNSVSFKTTANSSLRNIFSNYSAN